MQQAAGENEDGGFSMDDCDRIVRDDFTYAVKWKGNADISRLRGKAVYLRFELKRAGLFGFRVAG